jgi:3-oxoacyl-[acyl-carrier-protein] synthase II
MNRPRAVITGLGVLTSIGLDTPSFWKSLLEGICGINRITLFDPSGYRVQKAAEVKGFEPGRYFPPRRLKRMSRCDQLGMKAVREALTDSGLDLEKEDRQRMGIFIGGGAGGILSAEKYRKEMIRKGWRRARPSLLLPFSGEIDAAIAGGSESLSEVTFVGFNSLRSVDEEYCRPFDLNRKGLSLGEGAAFLILEEEEHARKRGARIHAVLMGYGLSGDGQHMTAPDPGGKGAARAMQQALKDSGRSPDEVGYINAHGTATPANDAAETKAIKSVFGKRAEKIPVSANKSMIGHCLGAAGALEAVATALAVRDDRIPPTIHYQTPDPDCDLDYVPNQARDAAVDIALSNSFAFGGNNTALVFGKWK